MKTYLEALQYIKKNGVDRGDRTGTGTRSVFGYQMRFNLQDGFPAVTTKKLAWKSVVSELLWFLEGSSDERRLAEILYGKDRSELKDKTTIWTANANNQGVALGYRNNDLVKELGPVYGSQWRNWYATQMPNNIGKEFKHRVDQIANVIESIQNDPEGRRHIVSAWNPGQIDQMVLPPCHMIFQFYVAPLTTNERNKISVSRGFMQPDTMNDEMLNSSLDEQGIPRGKLSCHMFQRSCDMFLGVPFNIASYALLTHMIAQVCNLDVNELVITLGDAHIYNNHLEQVNEQLRRTPDTLPTLKMNTQVTDINKFSMDDFKLINYNPQAIIKAEMAV